MRVARILIWVVAQAEVCAPLAFLRTTVVN